MTYPEKKMDKGEGWFGNSAPRRVFILGAGFSKAVSDLMPDTNELGRLIAEKLEIPSNLTRGTFEDWLSRLGEVQPDALPADNFQRQNYFHQIFETIGISLEENKMRFSVRMEVYHRGCSDSLPLCTSGNQP